ncbi:MAG: DUF1646 family protein [Elusimicrobia bacterium]|nr:DUF1646 family protein [Elusimicrobiota bacterium]
MSLLTIAGLGVVMGLVLALPFSVKKVEEELEAFLLVMGVLAVTISGKWSGHLVSEGFIEPVKITLAVLVVGFLFRACRSRVRGMVDGLVGLMGRPAAIMFIVFALGLLSSVITAIIAALVLSEVVTALRLDRKYEVRLVICACYAIGLGAALTPIGEPLATIAVSKLKGAPHHADFFFLAKLLAVWVVPGVAAVSFLAGAKTGHAVAEGASLSEDRQERVWDIVLRSLKVYLFVMALVFLGAGLAPLAEQTVAKVPSWGLYWINILSAILDNATLTAAEIVPSMSEGKITFLLMGLLIAGGMLIPGNIPNIICASKLGIKSKEWAVFAAPLGAVLLVVYFVVLLLAVGT